MGHKKTRYLLVGLAVCLTLLVAFGAVRSPTTTGNQPGEFNLLKPEFVTDAYAANSPIGTYLIKKPASRLTTIQVFRLF
jgi:hypothetical protein